MADLELWLGGLFLMAAFVALPAGGASGAEILATPSASAIVDPGRATPGDGPQPAPTPRAETLSVSAPRARW